MNLLVGLALLVQGDASVSLRECDPACPEVPLPDEFSSLQSKTTLRYDAIDGADAWLEKGAMVTASELNGSQSLATLLALSSHDISLQRKMTRSEAVLGAFEAELEQQVAAKHGDDPTAAGDAPSAEVEQRSLRIMLFGGAIVSMCGVGLMVTLMQIFSSEGAKSGTAKNQQRSLVSTNVEPPPVSRGGAAPVATGESLEWLNSIFEHIWPHVDKAVQTLVLDSIAPKLRESVPGAEISTFTLGDATPVLGPIEVHSTETGVQVRLMLDYKSDVDVSIRWGLVYVGVKSLSFKGQLHMNFSPLIDETPVVGGIQLYFLNQPEIDMDLTGAANIADCPGFADILHSTIMSAVAGSVVLPNVVGVQLGTSQQVDPVAVMTAQPLGLVRVTAVSASELHGADWHLTGKATSDPYVQVSFADREWHSSSVDGTTDPVWPAGESSDFMVFDHDQQIRVCVHDKNSICSDGVLGYCGTLTVEEALACSGQPLTLRAEKPRHGADPHPLAGTEDMEAWCGELVLRFEWFELDAPMLRAPGTSFTAAPTAQALVSIEVLDIVLPGDLAAAATGVCLRATLGGVSGATALRYETPLDSCAEDAAMELVAMRLGAHGVPPHIVSDVTRLSEAEVAAIANGGHVGRERAAGQAQKTFSVQSSVHLLVIGGDTEGDDVIDFAILDQSGMVLAETRQRLRGVPVTGNSGGSQNTPMVFTGAGGQRARAQLAMSVQGLRSQSFTAPSRKTRAARRGANNPFGIACC